ncbi:MAG: A24 family peptidase [Gammaproteobacteria bacterium]|nr:A24 family peptidase [Gammaproteobacteria bacterium]
MIEAACTVSCLATAVVAGMMAGGVLNLVIDHYPVYLYRIWTVEAWEQVGERDRAIRLKAAAMPSSVSWDLACPHCLDAVTGCLNTPLLGYLAHRGRFGCCKRRVPRRYFLVEGTTAVLWGASGYVYGIGWDLIPVLFLVCSLVVLGVIDLEHHILPDQIVCPLMAVGLAVNVQSALAPSIESALWGAISGYLAFWLVRLGHLAWRKQEGLGHGDCKLLAGVGAWTGWEMLPLAVAVSAAGCLGWCLLMKLSGQGGKTRGAAFGLWLATGGLCCVYWDSFFG